MLIPGQFLSQSLEPSIGRWFKLEWLREVKAQLEDNSVAPLSFQYRSKRTEPFVKVLPLFSQKLEELQGLMLKNDKISLEMEKLLSDIRLLKEQHILNLKPGFREKGP